MPFRAHSQQIAADIFAFAISTPRRQLSPAAAVHYQDCADAIAPPPLMLILPP